MNSIPIPGIVESDLYVIEILRLWVSNRDLVVVIASSAFDDPGEWGILLVDLARHVARQHDDRILPDRLLGKVRSQLETCPVNGVLPGTTFAEAGLGQMLSTPAALSSNAREIARVWKHADRQTFVLHSRTWNDLDNWGEFLAQLIRSIASIYRDRSSAEIRIRELFDVEWRYSTSEMTRIL